MSQQPEALRLAEILEDTDQMNSNADLSSIEVAAELRRQYDEIGRLHALNAELLEALNLVQIDCQYLHHAAKDRHLLSEPCPVTERIRATIARAEGEQK